MRGEVNKFKKLFRDRITRILVVDGFVCMWRSSRHLDSGLHSVEVGSEMQFCWA